MKMARVFNYSYSYSPQRRLLHRTSSAGHASSSTANRLASLCLIALGLLWFSGSDGGSTRGPKNTPNSMTNIEILDMLSNLDNLDADGKDAADVIKEVVARRPAAEDEENHDDDDDDNNATDNTDKIMAGSGSRRQAELEAGIRMMMMMRARGSHGSHHHHKNRSKPTASLAASSGGSILELPPNNKDKEPYCGYKQDDHVTCECDLDAKSYTCHFKSEDGLRNGLRSLLNATHTYYWDTLNMICESAIVSDSSSGGGSTSTSAAAASENHKKPFERPFLHHLRWWPLRIQRSLFLNGPVFERVHLSGNCSFSALFLKGLDDEIKSLTVEDFGQSILQHEFAVAADGDFHMHMTRLERIVVTRTRMENDILPKFFGRQPRFSLVSSFVKNSDSSGAAGTGTSGTGGTHKSGGLHGRFRGESGGGVQVLSVKSIQVTRCELKSVEDDAFGAFPAVEVIDLSRNRLTSLAESVFRGCHALRDLNLERNRLVHLSESLFTEMKTLRRVNLRGNKLALLPVIFSPNTFHHQELLLEGNPWNCRCKMSWLIAKSSIGRTWFDEPVCHEPDAVRGKRLLKGLALVYEKFC